MTILRRMPQLHLFRSTLLVFVLAALAACKQPLAIVGEGDIVDLSGSTVGCSLEQFRAGDTACTENDITGFDDVNYHGVPRPGWRFAGWQQDCSPRSLRELCFYNYALAALLPDLVMPPLTAVFEPVSQGTTDIYVTAFGSQATTVVLTNSDGSRYDIAGDYGVAPRSDVASVFGGDEYIYIFRDLPLDENYRLFSIVEGELQPIGWRTGYDGQGEEIISNVFSLTERSDCAAFEDATVRQFYLGSLDGNTTYSAICQDFSSNSLVPGSVTAQGFDPALPLSIEQPFIGSRSDEELIEAGLSALSVGWFTAARDYFERAELQTEVGESNSADAARFYLAISSLAAVFSELVSDGDASDLNRLSDLLDLWGLPNDGRRGGASLLGGYRSEEFSEEGEVEEQALTYLDTRLLAALENSSRLFSEVSQNFSLTRFGSRNGSVEENDYADARLGLALLKLELASSEANKAYNTSLDADALVNTDGPSPTLEQGLALNPDFLRLETTEPLAAAEVLTLEAIAAFEDAILAVQAEPDDQADDLFSLSTAEEREEALGYLTRVRQSIEAGATEIKADVDNQPERRIILDLRQFFAGGVDLRGGNLLPEVSGNDVSSCLPDPTFNGVVLSPDLNKELNEQADTCP